MPVLKPVLMPADRCDGVHAIDMGVHAIDMPTPGLIPDR
jgi:hypothetical protein